MASTRSAEAKTRRAASTPRCHSEGAERPKKLTQDEIPERRGDPSLSLRVTDNCPRITILGIGNLLLQDEGVGVHVVQELADRKIDYSNVDIIDGGTSPEILTFLDDGIDKLIIVDAVKGGNEPGTLYKLSMDDLNQVPATPVSLHEMGVPETLKVLAMLNRMPQSTVIIGVEPKIIDCGLELSPEIEQKLPELINLVLKEINEACSSPFPVSLSHSEHSEESLRHPPRDSSVSSFPQNDSKVSGRYFNNAGT